MVRCAPPPGRVATRLRRAVPALRRGYALVLAIAFPPTPALLRADALLFQSSKRPDDSAESRVGRAAGPTAARRPHPAPASRPARGHGQTASRQIGDRPMRVAAVDGTRGARTARARAAWAPGSWCAGGRNGIDPCRTAQGAAARGCPRRGFRRRPKGVFSALRALPHLRRWRAWWNGESASPGRPWPATSDERLRRPAGFQDGRRRRTISPARAPVWRA